VSKMWDGGCADGSCGCGTPRGLKGALKRAKHLFTDAFDALARMRKGGDVRLTKLAKHTG